MLPTGKEASVQRSRWPERWLTTIHINQLNVALPSAISVVNVHDLVSDQMSLCIVHYCLCAMNDM